MGRVKLKIQRLETLNSRQVTYGKRRAGILKKAQEISVLCDIPIVLIMFSPSGKASIFCGQRSNIDEMIAKYAQLTPKERAKRRLESLETLKRNFKKLDQDVDIEEFLDASTPSIEEMHNRVRALQAQLAEVHKRLSWWANPDKIDDVEHLNQMENSLRESLSRCHVNKNKLLKQPIIQFDCTNQLCDFTSMYEQELSKLHFPDDGGMPFPIATTSEQGGQPHSWLPPTAADNQHIILPPNEPHFLASNDVECSRDAAFPTCSSYFPDVKEEAAVDDSRQVKNERQDGLTIDDYTFSTQLRLPLNEQLSHHSFGNLSFSDLMETSKDANFNLDTMDYQNFEIQRSVFNTFPLSTPATSCAISMLNDNSYQQPPN